LRHPPPEDGYYRILVRNLGDLFEPPEDLAEAAYSWTGSCTPVEGADEPYVGDLDGARPTAPEAGEVDVFGLNNAGSGRFDFEGVGSAWGSLQFR